MAMTDSERKAIEDRAELIAEEVAERVITRVISAHLATCPHGRMVETWKQRLIGVGIVTALIAAGSSAGTALILKAF